MRAFFEDLGLLLPRAPRLSDVGVEHDVVPGVPTCREPTERLFYPAVDAAAESADAGATGGAGGVGGEGGLGGGGRSGGDGRGYWRDAAEDGLAPLERMSTADRAQYARFRELVRAEATRRTADGRPPFAVPLAECSRDAAAVRLDAISFHQWLVERGFTSPPLFWFLGYGTRDDYGSALNATSAWAGLHYFASRASEERFEWPEGNGRIVQMLLERICGGGSERGGMDRSGGGSGARSSGGDGSSCGGGGADSVRTRSLVYRIEADGTSGGVRVLYARPRDSGSGGGGGGSGSSSSDAFDASWSWSVDGAAVHALRARRVIYAAPLFTAAHVIHEAAASEEGWGARAAPWLSQFSYAPWLVANLHLGALPPELGMTRCDNVIYGTAGLGYTLSRARGAGGLVGRLLGRLGGGGGEGDGEGGVLTYYRALADDEPAASRRRMLAMPWSRWRDAILTELEAAHPSLRNLVRRLDVRLLGHAMARPTPGLVFGAARAAAAAARPLGRVHFAHSDMSALPLFEEAAYWGTRVAAEVALAL